MDFLRRGIQEVSAAANAAVEARRDTAAGGAAGPPGVAGGDAKAIDTVLKGFKDLRAVLQPAAAQAAAAGAGYWEKRGGPGGAAAAPPPQVPFAEAWRAYCAANPRLRDPKTLPGLARRGVPEDLRSAVWSHCLGVDASSASAVAAEALGASHARAPSRTSLEAVSPTISPCGSSPEVTPEDAGASPEDAVAEAKAEESPKEPGPPPPEELREVPRSTSASPRDSECDSRAEDVAMIGGLGHLPHRINELIEADVLRTFASVELFQASDGPNQLRRVLRTLAAGDQDLGYCQSLNFLAATFIVVLGDESAAHLAMRQLLVKLGTRCWYTDGMQQLRADTAVLEDLIQERLPLVHATLRGHRFDLLFVSSKWFMCLFSTTLQGEALMRVWDVILCDGIEGVFRVALAMMSLGAPAILGAKTHDDLIFLFQDWQLSASPGEIIAAAYDPRVVGHISRAELAQRRRQAATQVTKGDTRDAMFRNKCARGGVRAASMRAR